MTENYNEEVVEEVVAESTEEAAEETACEPKKLNVLGLLSMIFGIMGVLGNYLMAIAAIVLSCISKKKLGAHDGMSKAGFILGLVGTILAVVGIALLVLVWGLYFVLVFVSSILLYLPI